MDARGSAGRQEIGRDSGWSLSPVVRARTAGFPFGLFGALGDPALAAAWDEGAKGPGAGALNKHVESRSEQLASLRRDDRFLEAVFMQARNLARQLMEGRGTATPIELEDALVFYLQRLTVDAETLGFYGPYFWASVAPDWEGHFGAELGADIVARNVVCFEHRPIFQLARLAASDPSIQRELRPTLNPACQLDGPILRYPVARSAELQPAQQLLLRSVDGKRTFGELLAHLTAAPELSGEAPGAAEAMLKDFIERRILYCAVPLPVGPFPERRLIAELQRLPERCEGKAKWLSVASEFSAWSERYAAAPFAERRALTAQMEKRFEELTGIGVAPLAEDLYRATNLLYEDCARDVRGAKLGAGFTRRFERLSAYLDLARWVSLELPRRYEARFGEVWDRLSLDGSLRSVDLVQFIRETNWIGQNEEVEQQLRRELRDAWTEVLGERLEEGLATLHVTAEDCRAVLAKVREGAPELPSKTLEAFGAQFQTVDVALQAPDLAAISRGDYQLVVTDVHKSSCLATQLADQPFCPDRGAIDAFIEASVAPPAAQLSSAPETYQRFDPLWPDVKAFLEVHTEGATPRYPQERVLPIGALEVVQEGGTLFVRRRGAEQQEQGFWYFSVLTGFIQRRLTLIDPLQLGLSATPRVMLGEDLVLSRRRWVIDGNDLPEELRPESEPEKLFDEVRAFRRRFGLPEQCLVKSPSGPKPVAVDFTSFHSCRLFVRHIAEANSITVTELLPQSSGQWLTDSSARKYVCEFRITTAHRG